MKKMLLFAAMLMAGATIWAAAPRAQVAISSPNEFEVTSTGKVVKSKAKTGFRTVIFCPATSDWSDISIEIKPSADGKLVLTFLGETTGKGKAKTINWVDFDKVKLDKRNLIKTPTALSGAKYAARYVRSNTKAGTPIKITGKVRISTPESIDAAKKIVAEKAEKAAAKAKADAAK